MRMIFARLADPTHVLPIENAQVFPAEGRHVNADDPFYFFLLRDGSLVEASEPEPEPAAKPAPKSKP